MLDVVRQSQVKRANEVGREQVGNHDGPERDDERHRNPRRDEPGANDLVLERPDALLVPFEPPRFELPGPAKPTRKLT